jgi:hypothetical protein
MGHAVAFPPSLCVDHNLEMRLSLRVFLSNSMLRDLTTAVLLLAASLTLANESTAMMVIVSASTMQWGGGLPSAAPFRRPSRRWRGHCNNDPVVACLVCYSGGGGDDNPPLPTAREREREKERKRERERERERESGFVQRVRNFEFVFVVSKRAGGQREVSGRSEY